MILSHPRRLRIMPFSGTLTTITAVVATLTCFAAPAAHAQSAYASTVLSYNPVAYFRLGSTGAGSLVNGFTTSFNNGATVTAVGSGAPLAGEPNNIGASLPGTSGSYVTTSLDGQAAYATAGNATILAWVNLAQLPSVAGRYFYIAGRSQVANDLDLQIQNDDRLYFYTDSGSATSFTLNTSSLVGQYHFIAATVDTTAGTRSLYFDGALVATQNGVPGRSSSTAQFDIGASDVFGGREFNGAIDEVALYNTTLTGAQIQNLYANASVVVPESESVVLMVLGALPLAGLVVARRQRKTVSSKR